MTNEIFNKTFEEISNYRKNNKDILLNTSNGYLDSLILYLTELEYGMQQDFKMQQEKSMGKVLLTISFMPRDLQRIILAELKQTLSEKNPSSKKADEAITRYSELFKSEQEKTNIWGMFFDSLLMMNPDKKIIEELNGINNTITAYAKQPILGLAMILAQQPLSVATIELMNRHLFLDVDYGAELALAGRLTPALGGLRTAWLIAVEKCYGRDKLSFLNSLVSKDDLAENEKPELDKIVLFFQGKTQIIPHNAYHASQEFVNVFKNLSIDDRRKNFILQRILSITDDSNLYFDLEPIREFLKPRLKAQLLQDKPIRDRANSIAVPSRASFVEPAKRSDEQSVKDAILAAVKFLENCAEKLTANDKILATPAFLQKNIASSIDLLKNIDWAAIDSTNRANKLYIAINALAIPPSIKTEVLAIVVNKISKQNTFVNQNFLQTYLDSSELKVTQSLQKVIYDFFCDENKDKLLLEQYGLGLKRAFAEWQNTPLDAACAAQVMNHRHFPKDLKEPFVDKIKSALNENMNATGIADLKALFDVGTPAALVMRTRSLSVAEKPQKKSDWLADENIEDLLIIYEKLQKEDYTQSAIIIHFILSLLVIKDDQYRIPKEGISQDTVRNDEFLHTFWARNIFKVAIKLRGETIYTADENTYARSSKTVFLFKALVDKINATFANILSPIPGFSHPYLVKFLYKLIDMLPKALEQWTDYLKTQQSKMDKPTQDQVVALIAEMTLLLNNKQSGVSSLRIAAQEKVEGELLSPNFMQAWSTLDKSLEPLYTQLNKISIPLPTAPVVSASTRIAPPIAARPQSLLVTSQIPKDTEQASASNNRVRPVSVFPNNSRENPHSTNTPPPVIAPKPKPSFPAKPPQQNGNEIVPRN